MPELPEVETIRRGLASSILHKNIVDLEIIKDRVLRNSARDFKRILKNQSIGKIDRRGKLLIMEISGGEHLLLIHLKMTGQLIYVFGKQVIAGGHNLSNLGDLPNKYSHVIFKFVDGSQLFFNDLRQFGYLKLIKAGDRHKIEARYGLEPGHGNFKWVDFKKVFEHRSTRLKALLLNQQLISGLGNIYVDEVCFRAKVRPDRLVNSLGEAEIKALYNACQYIIKKAIDKRGTTFSDYRDHANQPGNFAKHLKVYGRGGQKCLRCKKAIIKKIKLVGRGTHFCPNCQK